MKSVTLNQRTQKHFSRLQVFGGVTITFALTFVIAYTISSLLSPVDDSEAIDTTIKADSTHYTTISAPSEVNISAGSASSTGTLLIQSESITTKTNSPSGYKLYLSVDNDDTNGNRLYRSGDKTSSYYINPTSGTATNPTSLSLNTWGFALGNGATGVPSEYGFDLASVYTATTPSMSAKFAAVPFKNNAVKVQQTSTANTSGQNLTIYYGALVSDSLISGTYSGTVNYTIVADATDITTISPTSQNTLAAGTEITIATPLYTNMSDLGTVTATVGGAACTDMTTSTATGVLVVKCKTPAKTTIGNYDVVVSVPKFNKSYTVKYGYKKTYTLTYNANGGTGAPATQTCTTDTTTDSCNITVSTTTPTRSASGFAYIFAGWSTSSSADTASYTGNGTIKMTSDTTIYAVWFRNFIVSYAAGSGTAGSITSQNCTTTSSSATSCNISISTSASPSRSNMSFYGWSTGNNTTRSYSAGSSITLSANITLYAIWSVTISYNANSGSGAPNAQTCYITYSGANCSIAISTTKPVKANHSFIGWGTTSGATSATYSAGTTYTFSANITLYGLYKLNYHTLTVTTSKAAYGSASTTHSGTIAAGTQVTVTATANQGYVFAGWMDGDSTFGSSISYTFTMPDRNLNLTASWSFDIEKITNINVLNVYPNTSYANFVKTGTERFGQGKITVTPVYLNDFNANPSGILGSSGNWNYDVVVFGFADCNRGEQEDLTAAAAAVTRQYSTEGHGVIAGHDTLTTYCYVHPNFNSLADLFDLTMRDTATLGDWYWHYTTAVRIVKEGIFTQRPNSIGGLGTLLTIPYTHAMQFAPNGNGDVWLSMNSGSDYESLPNSFYLVSYKNNALMMSGHSSGQVTDDEYKIIANIIFYMYSYDLMHR